MTRTGESFEPNLANYQIYNELYQRVYLRMYSQLKPLYEEICNITGYPPKF
jgi:sugar (pentulose or hexulose) kinase